MNLIYPVHELFAIASSKTRCIVTPSAIKKKRKEPGKEPGISTMILSKLTVAPLRCKGRKKISIDNYKGAHMNREQESKGSLLLSNLNTYISKNKITESILALCRKINKIESTSGKSVHTIQMRKEVEMLEDKLAYCKGKEVSG